MSYEGELERALDEAENQGTINRDDADQVADFRDEFDYLMTDEEGNSREHFPSADEVDEQRRGEWIEFLNDYDLWEEFREDWEDYEKA
jgi:hypothetical protein